MNFPNPSQSQYGNQLQPNFSGGVQPIMGQMNNQYSGSSGYTSNFRGRGRGRGNPIQNVPYNMYLAII